MAHKLEMGVGIWSMQSTKKRPRHFANLYQELIEDAQLCDELGAIHAIWQTEHHFWYDGYCRPLLTVAGGIAAATKHLRIGQSALLFFEHDPLRVAHQAAVLDQVSSGRLELGLGLGYRDAEFDGFNIDRRTQRRRFEERLKLVMRSLGRGRSTSRAASSRSRTSSQRPSRCRTRCPSGSPRSAPTRSCGRRSSGRASCSPTPSASS